MKFKNIFVSLRRRGEIALMPYLTAGYPNLERSLDNAKRVTDAGADVLEIGVPFSDPIADGPTIQQASRRALLAGATLPAILETFSRMNAPTPRVLMSYVNPLLRYGCDRVLDDLVEAGFSGLIVPDVPIEEDRAWRECAVRRGLGWIPLMAPTSPADRQIRIAARAHGFAYYVSVTGTTGARRRLPARLTGDLDLLRSRTDTPVAVGFGIASASQVRALAPHCDGIVIGSRLIDAIRDREPLEPMIRELKQATKEPAPC